MRTVEPPPPDAGSPLTRSLAACLGAILGAGDVPCPRAGHPDPWTVWREWLAERGLGLVPVSDPHDFAWPGPWIAVAAGGEASVAFGVPPDLVWSPLGGGATLQDVDAGFVVAPLDVALWAPLAGSSDRERGVVEAIAIAPAAAAGMSAVAEAVARPGAGLDGDRYAAGRGTFSSWSANGRDLTLIEAESIDALELEAGRLGYVEARRNVVTRGIDLNALVGRRFAVGEVECVGRRLCEPCAHLQRLTLPGTLRALVHRGGLRADVVTGGVIRVGDAVRALE